MEAPAPEWQPLRGIGPGIRTAQIAGLGTVAICNGIAAARHLLETQAWRDQFVAIEVMACVGGCLGGGGEPKSLDPLNRRSFDNALLVEFSRAQRAGNSPGRMMIDVDFFKQCS